MRRRLAIPNLGGAQAIVLHRPHPTVQALARQLSAIGLRVSEHWPDLSPEAARADFVFFDADMGHDAQFPWPPGRAPIPMIALIGSEAPGRIEWALGQGADAQLIKPVGDSGAYSALVIARTAFEARRALAAEIADLHRRLEDRQTVVQAVTLLAARGTTEAQAYNQLRHLAMTWRETIEQAAHRIVARIAQDAGGEDERSGRS